MAVSIDGYGNATYVLSKGRPITVIRVRTKLDSSVCEDDQLRIRALLPGVVFACIEGGHLVSYHDDTNPNSPDNRKARRIRAALPLK